ncbi:uncharacterized protein FSUBG_8002 [Fusarium subglutinans]|uniref:F-box domain-containing protein n=1 Tax=Gibberella subglutinans TaxID=42677 RepID=A0A8H5PRM7_GIBSU|nr:uncharacterized protein FSUBG_8002 [Fusarium subglutinans]KAF5601830.1 hypothetical protein FSUBG_8002 [Fusarium subglutinans]
MGTSDAETWVDMISVRALDHLRQQFCREAVRISDDNNTKAAPASGDEEDIQNKAASQLIHKQAKDDNSLKTVNIKNELLRLPAEIQLMILQHLTFGEVESLRRTCRLLRYTINKPFIRDVFPRIKFELLSTCFRCLRYDATRDHLIHADESDARYPLANECLDCVSSRGGFVVGRMYTLETSAAVCICRYCGFPVTSDAAWKEYEFHRVCYRRYRMILLYYFLVGCAQSTITVAAASLCWKYYKKEKLVLGPTVVNFLMACWVFYLSMVRGAELRTYHWSLLLEMGIFGLWIPPLTGVVRTMGKGVEGVRAADIATVFFIACNMLFRFINVLGNTLLVSEYKLWRRYMPNQPRPIRILNKVIAFLIFWTYPPSIEQKFPGKWWFSKQSTQAGGV